MNSETERIHKEDPNLAESLQILSKDIIDYWEARFRLLQAQATERVKRFGKAIAFGLGAVVFAIIAYFVGVAFLAVLLARQFDNNYLWPLLILTVAHLLLAVALAIGSVWKFKVPPGTSPRDTRTHPENL